MKADNQNPLNQPFPSQSSFHQNSGQEQEEETDLYNRPTRSVRQQEGQNSGDFSEYWQDLVNLLQLTVVILLIIMILVVGSWIVAEVHQFWFIDKQGSFAKLQEIKLIESYDQKEKMDEDNQQQGETLSVNEENQMEKALLETQGQQDNLRQQQNNLSRYYYNSRISPPHNKPSNHIKPLSNSPNSQQPQVYDPVLIQLNRYHQNYGSRYKQTIYTMKNTSITQKQYQRAKNLIELTKYYNTKQKKFLVKENIEGQQQNCGVEDLTCEKKQAYIDQIVSQQNRYYQQKYASAFTSIRTELPFCIIVPSYKNNHNQNIQKNLNSIFQQNYTNYHIVYIDDASQDGTAQVVQQYLNKYEISSHKLLFIQNKQNQKALKNIYTAAHQYCEEKQIMIIVDGDDYLIGTQVLRFLNYQYQTKTLLAAYTNYLRINQPYYIKVGTSTPYPQYVLNRRAFRRMARMFRASHLRSYYVDLFRKIKPQDLKDQNGQFFTAANDFAIMMPILEMASPHVQYLPELTYLYDSGTGLNNFQSKKSIQENNVRIVSRRKIYNQVDWNQFYVQK